MGIKTHVHTNPKLQSSEIDHANDIGDIIGKKLNHLTPHVDESGKHAFETSLVRVKI